MSLTLSLHSHYFKLNLSNCSSSAVSRAGDSVGGPRASGGWVADDSSDFNGEMGASGAGVVDDADVFAFAPAAVDGDEKVTDRFNLSLLPSAGPSAADLVAELLLLLLLLLLLSFVCFNLD